MQRRTLLATAGTIALAGCVSADGSDGSDDDDGYSEGDVLDVDGSVEVVDGIDVLEHRMEATGYRDQSAIVGALKNGRDEELTIGLSANFLQDGRVIDSRTTYLNGISPGQEAEFDVPTRETGRITGYELDIWV